MVVGVWVGEWMVVGRNIQLCVWCSVGGKRCMKVLYEGRYTLGQHSHVGVGGWVRHSGRMWTDAPFK